MCCRPDRATCIALLVCLVFGFVYAGNVSMERSMGWDEAMHVQWPAARMGLAMSDGEVGEVFATAHDSSQYPFVYPAILATAQNVFGMTEGVARAFGRWLWAFGCFGLFLLVREALRGRGASDPPVRGAGTAPWIAMLFGMTSPLAILFSGTLFLETPWTVVAIFTLLFWFRRRRLGGWHRDVLAGVFVMLAFFTKFNYGLMLGAALFLDLLFEVVRSPVLAGNAVEDKSLERQGHAHGSIRSALCVGAPIVLGMLWWFGFPLPEGMETAAAHRHAFSEWIHGNTEMARTPASYRWIHATCMLARTPVVFLILLVGLVGSLRCIRLATVRTLWIAFVVMVSLTLWHPFHLDRFFLPPGMLLWALSAIGWASLLPVDCRARLKVGGGVLLVGVVASCAAWSLNWWMLGAVGLAQEDSGNAVLQRFTLKEMYDVYPNRTLNTGGVARAEYDQLVGIMVADLRPGERVGWMGMNTSFPPASALFGLLSLDHEAGQQLRDSELDTTFVTLAYEAPAEELWTNPLLMAYARRFGVLYGTYPSDLNREGQRVFLDAMRERLVGLGWTMEIAAPFQHEKSPGDVFDAAFLSVRE